MRKKRNRTKEFVVRLVGWIIDLVLAGLFIYAYVTLMEQIPAVNVRLAVMILSLPLITSFWLGICLGLALIRERWLLDG